MKGTVLILIGVLISSCYFVAADNIGNQNYPTAYNNGGPSGAYDYLIFTFENATGTYYAAKDSFGRVVDAWTSTNDNTLIGNVVSSANAGDTLHINKGIAGFEENGIATVQVAQETVTTGQIVIRGASGYALANAENKAGVDNGYVYLVVYGASAESNCLVIEQGAFTYSGWSWTPGSSLYASTVDGYMNENYPTGNGEIGLKVGSAIDADTIQFASSKTCVTMISEITLTAMTEPTVEYDFAPVELTGNYEGAPKDVYSDGELLFMKTSTTVYRSNNNGVSWTKILEVPNMAKHNVFEKDTAGNLYVGADYDLWRSPDNGDSWTKVAEFTDVNAGLPITGGFFCLGNGTILSARYTSTTPILDRSDDYGETWSIWVNFHTVFPDYTLISAASTPYPVMRHLHSAYYFNNTFYVNTGDTVNTVMKSPDGATWTIDFPATYTSVYVLDDRVILGGDMGQGAALNLYKDGVYYPTYHDKEFGGVFDGTVFRRFSTDTNQDVIYTVVGYRYLASNMQIVASLNDGESWINILNVTNPVDDIQVVAHNNRLIYTDCTKMYYLPLPTRSELTAFARNEATDFQLYGSAYTSASQTAYANATIQLDESMALQRLRNPSFESYTGSTPNNWNVDRTNYFNGTTYQGQDTENKYDGDSSFYIDIGTNGAGRIVLTASTGASTPLPVGYYLYTIAVRVNNTFIDTAAPNYLDSCIYFTGASGINFESMDANTWYYWQGITKRETESPYVTVSIRIDNMYLDEPLRIWVDAVSVIPLSSQHSGHVSMPYIGANVTSQAGAVSIAGEEYSFSTFPHDIELDYLAGEVLIEQDSFNVLNASVTGTPVLTVENGYIVRHNTGVYVATANTGFTVVSNVEDAIIITGDAYTIISNETVSASAITFRVNRGSGIDSCIQIHLGNREPPSWIYGATNFGYNAADGIIYVMPTVDTSKITLSWVEPAYTFSEVDGIPFL